MDQIREEMKLVRERKLARLENPIDPQGPKKPKKSNEINMQAIKAKASAKN